MNPPTNPIDRLVRALRRLPGIGEKSATRLALFILRDDKELANDLVSALTFVREKVRFCKVCQNLSEEEICPICQDSNRDRRLICVVQEPVDLLAVEKTGEYRGLYHILHGALSPLDGIGPEDIRIQSLVKRIQEGGITEVILATNPNAEGEATALYLKKILSPFGIKITRIASGVPVGGTLEYTDAQTLSKALGNRKDF
jgi:recombination protein RecR